jgi:hypothetical protein
MELNFDDILAGNDQPALKGKTPKQSDTRVRQQSCMIDEVDKDLVKSVYIQLPANAKTGVQNFRLSLSEMLSLVVLLGDRTKEMNLWRDIRRPC